MSTQVLGDVELVTKQELEAALDAVVVPEDDINSKIEAAGAVLEQAIAAAKAEVHSEVEVTNAALAQETTNRTAKDAEIVDMIHDEANLRETTDDALRSRIEREEGVREAADHELSELIAAEVTERKAADEKIEADIIEHLKERSHDSFEDTIFCVRLKNLPIAQATVELHDSTLAVGDIIGSVAAEYLPDIPITFNFVAELVNQTTGDLEYFYIGARLDAAGNAIIINKSKLEGTFVGNVNSTSFMYITKE